jgi:prepilin-type N-terminal cleavage/methylation domain-containing protein
MRGRLGRRGRDPLYSGPMRQSGKVRRGRAGFSLLEVMIVVLVIGVAAAISIPAVNQWLKTYRLGMAAQQVADALQATKMQAVAKTRKRELLFDVETNRLGLEGTTLGDLPSGVSFGTGRATEPPDEGASTDAPVTFPPVEGDPTLRAATFTGKGIPDADPGEVFAVYLTNDAGTRAVTMTSAGNVRVHEWTGTSWE